MQIPGNHLAHMHTRARAADLSPGTHTCTHAHVGMHAYGAHTLPFHVCSITVHCKLGGPAALHDSAAAAEVGMQQHENCKAHDMLAVCKSAHKHHCGTPLPLPSNIL